MRKKNSLDSSAVALLLGFSRNQREDVARIYQEIRQHGDLRNKVQRAYLGYLLHNLYCALEDLFQEIARIFENQIEDPERYHHELLKRMGFEVPGIRPALLSRQSSVVLDDLRSFRHVFRHAYTHELDQEKLAALKAGLAKGWLSVLRDMNRFEKFLEKKMTK